MEQNLSRKSVQKFAKEFQDLGLGISSYQLGMHNLGNLTYVVDHVGSIGGCGFLGLEQAREG